jgi:Fe-S cluster assembly protein SufD
MSAQLRERHWFDDTVARNRERLLDSDQAWLNRTREQARHAIRQLPVPDRKQEAWRYTDVTGLYQQELYSQAAPVTGLVEEDIEHWVYSSRDSYRLVFANGCSVPTFSNIELLPNTIKIGSLRAALTTDRDLVTSWLEHNAGQNPDVFTELNRSLINDGLFIHVADNIELPLPIEVVYLNLSIDRDVLSQPHSLIVLGAGAKVKLIERFVSTGDSHYFFNGMSEVFLGAHASLEHYRLQDESPNAHHLSRVAVRQHSASEYRSHHIATGARWHRSDIRVNFTGAQADCDLKGIYTVGERQYTDFHLDVQHTLPGCRSREDFRGIVSGQGRAVFDGRIVVHPEAQKTDAMLSNKNLLLAENAEVDTKPQLEIYADDVKCGHGTTVGKLDPDQLYYLRSRGISEVEAKRMLCLGFAEQILAQIDDPRLHDFIQARIASGLAPRRGQS